MLMKKLFPLAILLQVFMIGHSQIVLQGSDLPGANDTLRITLTDGSGINVNQTGPNFTWNFASLPTNSQSVLEYKSSLQTPYALFFLGLNIFGLKGQDLTFGGFGLTDLFDFYIIDNSQYAVRGIGFKFQNVPLGATYSQNQRIFRLPLRFNDRDSSNFSVTIQLPDIGRYKSSGYRKYEVDGWGKVTTPNGTFDCLRVKSFISSIDSFTVSLAGLNFNFGIPNDRYEYAWYAKGQKAPVLQVEGRQTGTNFVATRTFYRGFDRNPATAVSESESFFGWSIYPNPTNSVWQMTADPTVLGATLSLFDLSGKLLQSEILTRTQHTISVDATETGLYLAVLEKDGKREVKQLLLVR
jgi:hypothetical protein